jgi:alanine racemase
MIRPTFAHIDLEALQLNFRAVRDYVGRPHAGQPASGGPKVIAVVKANAYGHGAGPVGLALERAGAGMLACADIEEGILLRDAGVTIPILVFGALSVSDLDGIFTHDLIPTISTPSAGRAVQAAAAARNMRVRCHLKIDTGMNRLGFRHDNIRRTLPELAASPNVEIDAVYTHFATADDPDQALFDEQRARFERVWSELQAIGITPRFRHAANTAALLRDPRVWYDAVRPGILLYGVVPPPLHTAMTLRPVMSLRSRIVAVKGMREGESLGYGARFIARRPTTVAVIPAGYADGIDVRLGGRGSVLLRGREVPIVGSVCMDMIMVDVTGLDVQPGDEVIILGEQGGAQIDVCRLARTIGTIPYEVLCRVGSRIERVYNEPL